MFYLLYLAPKPRGLQNTPVDGLHRGGVTKRRSTRSTRSTRVDVQSADSTVQSKVVDKPVDVSNDKSVDKSIDPTASKQAKVAIDDEFDSDSDVELIGISYGHGELLPMSCCPKSEPMSPSKPKSKSKKSKSKKTTSKSSADSKKLNKVDSPGRLLLEILVHNSLLSFRRHCTKSC